MITFALAAEFMDYLWCYETQDNFFFFFFPVSTINYSQNAFFLQVAYGYTSAMTRPQNTQI